MIHLIFPFKYVTDSFPRPFLKLNLWNPYPVTLSQPEVTFFFGGGGKDFTPYSQGKGFFHNQFRLFIEIIKYIFKSLGNNKPFSSFLRKQYNFSSMHQRYSSQTIKIKNYQSLQSFSNCQVSFGHYGMSLFGDFRTVGEIQASPPESTVMGKSDVEHGPDQNLAVNNS